MGCPNACKKQEYVDESVKAPPDLIQSLYEYPDSFPLTTQILHKFDTTIDGIIVYEIPKNSLQRFQFAEVPILKDSNSIEVRGNIFLCGGYNAELNDHSKALYKLDKITEAPSLVRKAQMNVGRSNHQLVGLQNQMILDSHAQLPFQPESQYSLPTNTKPLKMVTNDERKVEYMLTMEEPSSNSNSSQNREYFPPIMMNDEDFISTSNTSPKTHNTNVSKNPRPKRFKDRESISFNKMLFFCLGGANNSGTLKSCEKYHINEDKWEFIPNLLFPMEKAGACMFQNKYIYIFGVADYIAAPKKKRISITKKNKKHTKQNPTCSPLIIEEKKESKGYPKSCGDKASFFFEKSKKLTVERLHIGKNQAWEEIFIEELEFFGVLYWPGVVQVNSDSILIFGGSLGSSGPTSKVWLFNTIEETFENQGIELKFEDYFRQSQHKWISEAYGQDRLFAFGDSHQPPIPHFFCIKKHEWDIHFVNKSIKASGEDKSLFPKDS